MPKAELALRVSDGFGRHEHFAPELCPQHDRGAGYRRLVGGADHRAFDHSAISGRATRQGRTRQKHQGQEHGFESLSIARVRRCWCMPSRRI